MSTINDVATALDHWFREGVSRYQNVTSALAGDDPNRMHLITHGAVARSARELLGDAAGHNASSLFSPACTLLSAGSRFLGLSVDAGNWKAAVENALDVQRQLEGVRDLAFGLPSAASELFLAEIRTQLENASFGHSASVLNEENRRRALAMALNFALRFLVAIGIEGCESEDPGYERIWKILKPLHPTQSNAT